MLLAQALIHLCRSKDGETQGVALQSLELLAIESADMLRAQEGLVPILLQIPHDTVDGRRQTLAAKLLLYYSEQREVCSNETRGMTVTGLLKENYIYFRNGNDSVSIFKQKI